ncbi:hypothetical protein HMPREF9148_00429 [Prevotella sp. F0091]|nr:hypothetical protein HMPREF9148_00429 [Prevotella sp. F0091]
MRRLYTAFSFASFLKNKASSDAKNVDIKSLEIPLKTKKATVLNTFITHRESNTYKTRK